MISIAINRKKSGALTRTIPYLVYLLLALTPSIAARPPLVTLLSAPKYDMENTWSDQENSPPPASGDVERWRKAEERVVMELLKTEMRDPTKSLTEAAKTYAAIERRLEENRKIQQEKRISSQVSTEPPTPSTERKAQKRQITPPHHENEKSREKNMIFNEWNIILLRTKRLAYEHFERVTLQYYRTRLGSTDDMARRLLNDGADKDTVVKLLSLVVEKTAKDSPEK